MTFAHLIWVFQSRAWVAKTACESYTSYTRLIDPKIKSCIWFKSVTDISPEQEVGTLALRCWPTTIFERAWLRPSDSLFQFFEEGLSVGFSLESLELELVVVDVAVTRPEPSTMNPTRIPNFIYAAYATPCPLDVHKPA